MAGCDGGGAPEVAGGPTPTALVTGSDVPSLAGSADPAPGGSDQPAPGGSGPPGTTAAPTTTGGTVVASPAAPNRTDVLVSYGRQGGIAGVHDRFEIRENGSFTITDGRTRRTTTGQLEAADLTAVRQVLRDSRFADLQTFNRGPRGADLFSYEVIYQGRQVYAQDGGVPPPLRPVLGLLGRLLSRYR
ncbi:MAG TPA: hypothetical protein VF755_10855 [Catenuloplanes sp.]|jgi:hypothetical protein